MINIFLIYSVISFTAIFFLAIISYRFNLVDIPNKRKPHSKPTAYTGGIILSLIYVFAILLFSVNIENLNSIVAIGFLISIVGFIDDKYKLSTGGKLSLQIIPIIYLIIIENLSLIQLGGYNYFKLELNSFSIPFTLLAVLFLINSFNYFDGLDGTLSFTTISVIIILYFLSSNQYVELFLIIFLLPLLIFLCFNFSILKLPKLFLGDGGSLLLGFIIAFTLIYIANQNLVHPILLAWSVSIFVYEFLSVNLIRLQNNKGVFTASLDHLHHILLKKNKSIFLTNFLISITNIILFGIGYISFEILSPLISLSLFIICFIFFYCLRKKIS